MYGVRKFPPFSSNPRFIESRNMKYVDVELFIHDLKNAQWDLLHISEDPNDMVYTWENLFLETLDKHAPLRKRRVKPCPWFTPFIEKSMYKRDYLKKRYVKNGSKTSYET